jgi:hypothetical protein
VTCQSLPTLLTLTGTNDPTTGAFSFVVPPVPPPSGSGSVPPGPDGSFTGTVAADGQTFGGTLVLCTWIVSAWQCEPVPMDGIRFGGPATCGNGLVEPGERCDQGTVGGVSLNGDQCCSATCDLVDPDGDLVCSRFDDCPVTPDAEQADSDHDGIGDACDPGLAPEGPLEIRRLQHRYSPQRRGSLRIDVSYAGVVEVPSVIEVGPVECGDVLLSTVARVAGLVGGAHVQRACDVGKVCLPLRGLDDEDKRQAGRRGRRATEGRAEQDFLLHAGYRPARARRHPAFGGIARRKQRRLRRAPHGRRRLPDGVQTLTR